MIGDDLIAFIDNDLFPFLASFRQSAAGPRTIDYKIGEIFTQLPNKFRSGYILRDVIEIVDGLSFNTQDQRHELSELYESRIRRMGNAGRNGGEYYTPRPLIRAMIKVVDPKIGETVYDGAVGSAGFLCEAWEHMRRPDLAPSDYETLQNETFFGQEKKSLAYIIGIMNMVLHGIEAPNIVHTNSLNENVMDFQEKDRHDIVLANPPSAVASGARSSTISRSARARPPISSCNTSSASCALAAGRRWSSRTPFSATPTTHRWRCAATCWSPAPSTPFSTARPAPSTGQGSRRWCSSSRRARRRGTSGSINSIPAARWGRSIP